MSHSISDASVLAVVWTKSSHSGQKTDCVEVAILPSGEVAVRDSKDPRGPATATAWEAWQSFVTAVQRGTI